jgi:hypothetical protein
MKHNHEINFTTTTKKSIYKKPITKLAKVSQTPTFKIIIRKPANPKKAARSLKSQKRGNVISKSRHTREDRGSRQMKTTHSSQTFFHVCALL